MNSLSLNFDWLTSGNDAPEMQQTMGMFGLKVGEISLTRNEDIWSQTIRDTVLVSAYPLAAWTDLSFILEKNTRLPKDLSWRGFWVITENRRKAPGFIRGDISRATDQEEEAIIFVVGL